MSSRFQADLFFNSFKVLRANDAAFLAHNVAAAVNLETQSSGPIPTVGVSVVCLAFSVELYIKDVYFALGKKPPRGHNIIKLYKSLPKLVRRQIFFHPSIISNPWAVSHPLFSPQFLNRCPYKGFFYQLKDISKGFEQWRYSYESTSLRYNDGFASAFIDAVKDSADKIRERPHDYNSKG